MLQGGEIIIILLLALVVFGPTRLPELAQKLGRWTAELRAAARDVRSGLEAEVADLQRTIDQMQDEVKELKKPLDDVIKEAGEADPRRIAWTGPKPVSGPTPEDAMADLEEIEGNADAEDGA